MKIVTSLALAPINSADIESKAHAAATDLQAPADLVILFVSAYLQEEIPEILATVHDVLKPKVLTGCSSLGVIAQTKEIEQSPAVSICAMSLPGVTVHATHVTYGKRKHNIFHGLPEIIPAEAGILALADPYSFPSDAFTSHLNTRFPGIPCIGGLASGGQATGVSHLFYNTEILEKGAIVVTLSGPIHMHTVVSQGCRPIGVPYTVTKSEENTIEELGGQPALQRLMQIVSDANPRDQELIKNGVQIGHVIDEHKAEFERGDFLIRNLTEINRASGTITVGEITEVGSTVQFHVRDAETAAEDLTEMLLLAKKEIGTPAGALLFTCSGRGTRLFSHTDHDANAIDEIFPALSTAGFFCAGEIGPIGEQNFVHGYTASIGLFVPTHEN